jgi:hypothetical protein
MMSDADQDPVPVQQEIQASLDAFVAGRDMSFNFFPTAETTLPLDQGDNPPLHLIRVTEANARLLGVHRAIEVEGSFDELPTYVRRDIDTDPHGILRKFENAARQGGFVLLVGESSVGKTRCAYEGIRSIVPERQFFHPADATEIKKCVSSLPPRTVIWLDELQRYLDSEHGLTAAIVRTLIQREAMLIGTLWPDRYERYTGLPSTGGSDSHPREREVVELAEIIHIAGGFSRREYARARDVAATDARIRVALDTKDYGLTQVIAAAPELMARWDNADPYARAVLTAAIDAGRLGAEHALPTDFLRAAAPGYCAPQTRASAPADWFEAALAYATRTLHGATAPLMPGAPVGGGMGQISGYTVADYVLQQASRQRRTIRPPAQFWDACIEYLVDVDDLTRVANSAEMRLLYGYAVPLYRRAAEAGERFAGGALVNLLVKLGQTDELRARAESGDDFAAVELLEVLANTKDDQELIDELRALVDRGVYMAEPHLFAVFKENERVDELRDFAEAGNDLAADDLARLLVTLGRADEATAMMGARADDGNRNALGYLANWYSQNDQVQEAVQAVRVLMGAGDVNAAQQLADLLAKQGNVDDLRDLAESEGPDSQAAHRLADILAELGEKEELQRLADAGSTYAATWIGANLADEGKIDEGIAILWKLADDGLIYAMDALRDVLTKHDRIDDLRARSDSGDGWSARRLSSILENRGEYDEAIAVLRKSIDSGDVLSHDPLIDLLRRQGRSEDADRIDRYGFSDD